MMKQMRKIRCEHNCHLCKNEWLGRCHGKHYGKDISVEGTDIPVCDEYVYGGSEDHLKEIECATRLGVRYIYIDVENDKIQKEE